MQGQHFSLYGLGLIETTQFHLGFIYTLYGCLRFCIMYLKAVINKILFCICSCDISCFIFFLFAIYFAT